MTILASAIPYYETDSFIATHAGIKPTIPWEVQRHQLHGIAGDMSAGNFDNRPPQWFSMKLATSTQPIRHTDKTVISGHAHILRPKEKPSSSRYSSERSLHRGKRIRLASPINPPTKAPVHIWQDWDEEIIMFPQDGGIIEFPGK